MINFKTNDDLGCGGCRCLMPALRRQRCVNLCEFGACLVYRAGSTTAKAMQRKPSSKQQKTKIHDKNKTKLKEN